MTLLSAIQDAPQQRVIMLEPGFVRVPALVDPVKEARAGKKVPVEWVGAVERTDVFVAFGYDRIVEAEIRLMVDRVVRRFVGVHHPGGYEARDQGQDANDKRRRETHGMQTEDS